MLRLWDEYRFAIFIPALSMTTEAVGGAACRVAPFLLGRRAALGAMEKKAGSSTAPSRSLRLRSE
jgi:hypothetical protein